MALNLLDQAADAFVRNYNNVSRTTKIDDPGFEGKLDPRVLANDYFPSVKPSPPRPKDKMQEATMFRTDPRYFGALVPPLPQTPKSGRVIQVTPQVVHGFNMNALHRHLRYHVKLLETIRYYFTYVSPTSRDRTQALGLIDLFHVLLDGCGIPGASGYTNATENIATYRRSIPGLFSRTSATETPERWALWIAARVKLEKVTSNNEVTLRLLSVDVHRDFVTQTVDQYWVNHIASKVDMRTAPAFMHELHTVRSLLEFWSPHMINPDHMISPPLPYSPELTYNPDWAQNELSIVYASINLLINNKPTVTQKKAMWVERMEHYNRWLSMWLNLVFPPIPVKIRTTVLKLYTVDVTAVKNMNHPQWWHGQYGHEAFQPSKLGSTSRISMLQAKWCMFFIYDMMPEFRGKPSMMWWHNRIFALLRGGAYPGPPDAWGKRQPGSLFDTHVVAPAYLIHIPSPKSGLSVANRKRLEQQLALEAQLNRELAEITEGEQSAFQDLLRLVDAPLPPPLPPPLSESALLAQMMDPTAMESILGTAPSQTLPPITDPALAQPAHPKRQRTGASIVAIQFLHRTKSLKVPIQSVTTKALHPSTIRMGASIRAIQFDPALIQHSNEGSVRIDVHLFAPGLGLVHMGHLILPDPSLKARRSYDLLSDERGDYELDQPLGSSIHEDKVNLHRAHLGEGHLLLTPKQLYPTSAVDGEDYFRINGTLHVYWDWSA